MFLLNLQGNVYVSLGERAMVMFPIDSTAEIEVCPTFISSGQLFFTFPSVECFAKLSGFPLTLENLEKWEGIFQSGKFEETGNVMENHQKYWKNWGFSDKCHLLFLMIFR